jgi:hypothetical protein
MLSRKGNKAIVKVLDFGLARATREQKVDGGLTHEGQALGTPDFIAPEQILDAPSADIRADIYSLGGTLYYLLTGRPPFRANSLYDLYQAHISRDADPLNFVRPEVPAELAALVAKMMAKDPARRFQTPAEVAQALTPFFKNGNARFRSPQAHLSQAGLPDTGRTPTDARPLPSRTAADPGTAPLPKSTVEPPGPEPTWSSLIDLRETEPSLAPVQAAGSPRRPRWVGPAVGVGLVLLGLLVAWAAGVFRVQTRDGVIVLEDLPKDAEVFVDGSRVTVNWPDGGEPAEITVPAGQRGVQVKRGGFETFGQRVTVATGGKAEIRVRFEPPATSRPDDVAAVGANPADGSEPGALAAFSQPGTNDAESRAFVPLFNGRDFSGWKEHPRQPGNWRIKDGVLIGSGPAMGHLYTRRDDYRDFHLRIEDRINDVGNSGVIFRAPFGPAFPPDNPRFPLGYEAQINNLHRDPNKTGSLYVGGAGAVVGLPRSPTPPFQWFTLEVIAVGNHIVIKVNGVTTTDYTDEQRRLTSGHIALQQFGPETIAEFRKVEIRELPAIPQAARPADARAFLGKSYKVFNQPLSWHEAQERCRAMGGHLAIVTNERESGFLLSLLRAQGLDATWLGATDERVEGQWMWVDGSPMRYSNWDLAQRQPNNKMGSEHYLMILASRDGKWSDQPDHSDQYRPSFICQWD